MEPATAAKIASVGLKIGKTLFGGKKKDTYGAATADAARMTSASTAAASAEATRSNMSTERALARAAGGKNNFAPMRTEAAPVYGMNQKLSTAQDPGDSWMDMYRRIINSEASLGDM